MLGALLSFTLGALLCLLATPAHASELHPPVLPLIVRNPYLSTWLKNARSEPWSEWPMFWTGGPVRGSLVSSAPRASR